jgi:hypothetical protein
MLVYMCVSAQKLTAKTLFLSRLTRAVMRQRLHFTPLCMYYLFNQLRISKSELESKLGKGLKDRCVRRHGTAAAPTLTH